MKMMDVPVPCGITKKLALKLDAALGRMKTRDIGPLVEQQLRDCHTPSRARELAAGPLVLPKELRQEDRQALDDAVLELIGVANAKERKRLRDQL